MPIAVAFAAGLNAYLVLRFVYPLWVSPSAVWLGGLIGLLLWVACLLQGVRTLPAVVRPASVAPPDRYADAQAAFLASRLNEAEHLLQEQLTTDARDPASLLMLSAIYRQSGRSDLAAVLMPEIRRLDAAAAWGIEIELEQRRIDRSGEASAGENDPGERSSETDDR